MKNVDSSSNNENIKEKSVFVDAKEELLNAEIKKHTLDEREKERRIDILKYSVKEINQAKLEEGEYEELEEEYKVLKNYEELVSAVTSAYNNLKLDDNSAMTMFEKALAELIKIKDFSNLIIIILRWYPAP